MSNKKNTKKYKESQREHGLVRVDGWFLPKDAVIVKRLRDKTKK